MIAYFSVPEDVDVTGVDAVSGASIVVSDEEKLGNTQYVAELIQDAIGGDLFRIETVAPYPLDHEPLVDQASEEKAAAVRPELSAQVENFAQYDVILLGYPNWWADLPMPVYSFLESYDFGAKTIIPFITHGGSCASRTVETIAKLQPDAVIYDNALVLSRNDVASSVDDVTAWIIIDRKSLMVAPTIFVTIIIAKRVGFDPAVMASPFITTVVDALSLLIYFEISTRILGL